MYNIALLHIHIDRVYNIVLLHIHIDRVYNIVLLHIHIDRAGELISYTVLNGSHMNMLTFNMYYVNISTVPPLVDAEKENYKD